MFPLLKVVLTLGAFFTSTFVIAKLTGLFDLEQIRVTLEGFQASGAPWWVGAIVSGVLFADLFIAVPTLELSILAGHVLGFAKGFGHTLLGVCAAGLTGFALSRWKGEYVVRLILRDPAEREDMRRTFQRYGVVMIFLSRALPVLPEVSACMAGVTGMPLRRFVLAWLTVNVPYMALATYSGSVSSLQNPFPAIAAAIGLSVVFWAGWMVFRRRMQGATADTPGTDVGRPPLASRGDAAEG